MSISVGDSLGPYVVDGFIGSGGMGSVYRARDPRLGRPVAIKVLAQDLVDQADFRQRFQQETHAISRLNHKNICTIYDSGVFDGQPFIVMELMEGETLEAKLEAGPLPTVELLNIGIQVADALEAAHREGIIHRDVKSANIFITPRGDAKILDFGLAKAKARDPAGSSSGLTQVGVPVGTPGYMSPEQARGEPVDARSDVFSFGVVLFQAATGLLPFRGSAGSAMARVLSDDPAPAPRGLNPSLPVPLDRLIRRAIEKDPALRYQTARDLLAALRGIRRELISGSALPAADHRPSRWRRRATQAVAGLVLLVLSVVAGRALGVGGRSLPRTIAVIPCAAGGASQGDEYLCDLLAERLTFSLDALPEIEVRSQQAVRPALGARAAGELEVGRALDVDAVLTLDLRQGPDSVSVTATVTDVRDGRFLWGDRFSAAGTDDARQRLPEAIAAAATEGLSLQLSTGDRARIRVSETYQQAQSYMARRDAEGLREAIALFEQVIAADSTRAEAYAGLAKAYVLQAYYSGTPPFIAYPAGRAAAEKALRLDPLAAEAHAALGLVKRDFDWDWAGAEESFQRAVRLDPRSGTSHQWYAELLVARGRYAEAMERIDQAIEVEPLSLTAQAVRGWILICAGRLDEAEAALAATRDRDPEFPLSHWWLGQLYVRRGAFDRAIPALMRAVDLAGSSRMVADLAGAYALAGEPAASRRLLSELDSRAGNASVSQYEYAVVYAALGDETRALYELEAAMRERTWQVVNMGVDPMLGSLRTHARYAELLEQLDPLGGP